MKQTQRIKHLYNSLIVSKLSYSQLLKYFEEKNIALGLRQLQRDIKELESLLGFDEELIKTRGLNKVLKLQIKKRPERHNCFSVVESEYNTPFNAVDVQDKLAFFDKAIINKVQVSIGKLELDPTSHNADFKIESITVFPISIIFHRSSYYLGVYDIKKNAYGIFDIRHIGKYKLGRKPSDFNYKSIIIGFKKYTNGHFGVTKNIDDNIYKITLEFSMVTGTYVMNFNWHHSQKFKRKDNTIVMTLKCGINRELVGWIFMWLYNVRVIGPPELNDYYNKAIKEIEKINTDKSLLYKNIFV